MQYPVHDEACKALSLCDALRLVKFPVKSEVYATLSVRLSRLKRTTEMFALACRLEAGPYALRRPSSSGCALVGADEASPGAAVAFSNERRER